MDIIEKHNMIIGGVIATLTYVFGEHWTLFGIFLLFNVIDWITGWLKSKLNNKENSVKGLSGVMKKLGYWLMIFLSFAAGYWFISMGHLLGIDLAITKLLGWFVLASLTVNEFRSILENFVEAGFDVPKVLVNGLEVADKAFNQNQNKEERQDG